MNRFKFLVLTLSLIMVVGLVDGKAKQSSADLLNSKMVSPEYVNVFGEDSIGNKNDNSQTIKKYGDDSVKCVKNLSLYREFYKQWKAGKYKDPNLVSQAMLSWRYCFFTCPLVSKNMYIHGDKMLKYLIKANKADSVVMQAYVDTLMMVYDQRIQYFGNDPKAPKGKLLGRKAKDYMKYRVEQSEVYYPMFEESFKLRGNNSEPTTLFYFYVASVRYVQQKHAEKDLILENYVNIQDALEYNLIKYADNPKKFERYTKVNNNLEKNVSKFATCEKLVQLYGPKLEANPDDLKLAKNIVKFFEKRKCTKSDVYFNALEKVHAVEPSPESAFSMGRMAFERKQFDKAKTYLEEATSTLSDSLVVVKASAYLLLSETYRSLKQFQSARSAALKVLKYNPKEGMAYILIGDLYTSSAASCTLQGLRVSYWAAADKYARAIAISGDAKTKELAQKKLATIKKSFPEQQDIFMRSLTEGQKVTVECWINEETTVRSRK